MADVHLARTKLAKGLRYVLDWTTAWVCSEVPEAILVKAQAASNWREGLDAKGSKVSVNHTLLSVHKQIRKPGQHKTNKVTHIFMTSHVYIHKYIAIKTCLTSYDLKFGLFSRREETVQHVSILLCLLMLCVIHNAGLASNLVP